MRTLFHSKQILTKNPENTDKRVRFLKAGRFFVCVLMLLAMSGAAWGAEYRWKPEGDTTGNMEWSSVNNWQSAVWPNGNSSDVPGGDDRVFIRGSGTETVIKLTGETSLDELIINSDNAGSHVVRIIAENPTVFNIIKLYLALPGDASAFTLILEDVSLSCTTIEVNNDTNNHKNGGEFIISGTGSSSISATTVNIYADAATSPGSMKIDFGNVPMTATNVNVNAAEKTGTVEIATDSSITVEGCMNIGKYDQNGNNGTKTVFSGSGSVTTETLDFPNANNHELTIEEGVALGFSSGGTFYQDTSGSITINGSGTIDFQNAGIDTTNNDKPQGLHISPDTIVLNPPGNNTYTMTVGTMTGFPSSSVQSVTIHIVASTTESSLNDRYKKFLYTFSQNGNQFTFNGNNNASSQIQLSSGSGNSYSGDFTLSYNNSGLSAGNGFTLTIYRPDGIVLGTVSWYQGVPGWTGASSTAWNTLGNWTGITDLGDLSTKDISINSSAQNQPEISTDVQVKTLTITNNATVTQTEGSFSVESITCQGTGKFIEDGGTVQFNGSDGTYSAVYNGDTYFNNVSIESGKKLTLNSDLYLKGNLTVNGTLTQNGKSLVFRGSSQSISGVTSLDAITVKNGATVTLGADFTVGKLTVESGGTLDCSGHTLTITDSSTIAGTVTAEKCIATGMGGKTLTINGTLSVSDTLTLEGTDADHKLVITGVGTIKLAASQTGGKWLDVTYGTVPVVHDSSDGTTVTYTASYSSGPATNPTGWKIFSGASAYTWTGNAGSNDWGTAGNWDVSESPEEGSTVTIDTALNYPETPAAGLSIASLTVCAGTNIILGGNLTVTGEVNNAGTIDTNGKILTFNTYTDASDTGTGDGTGLIKLGENGGIVTTSTGPSAGRICNVAFTGTRNFADIENLTFVNATVHSSTVLTLSGDFTVTGEVNNAGTINTNGKTLTFNTYTDASDTGTSDGTGLIKLGENGGIVTTSTGPSAGRICNVAFTGTRSFADIENLTFVNVTVDSSTVLTLSGDFTVTGTLSNAGTIDTNGKTLTFGSYVDSSTSGTGLVKIAGNNALALYTGGTGGEIKNLEFTATSEFKDITGLAFDNVTVDAGVELKMTGSCKFDGTLNNKGLVNLNSHTLQFASYTHTGTSSDKIASNGGKIISTGDGTGSSAISTVQVTTGLTVTNNGTSGSLKLTSTEFSGSASLTVGPGSGLAPVFTSVKVTNGTLTLNSALTADTLINNGTVSSDGFNLTCTTYTKDPGVTTDALVLSGAVTLDAGTSTVSTINVSAGTLTAGGSELKAGTLNVTAGTTELAGTMNVTTLNVTGGDATISGAVTAGTVMATGLGGQTFTVDGTLKVTSTGTDASATLTLEGTETAPSTGTRLNVAGNGTIKINGSQVGGKWLSVSNTGPAITDLDGNASVIYTATWSVPSGTTATEFNGWYLCDGNLIYKWKGTTSTLWSDPTNWSVRSVPGASADVEIPDVSVAGGSVTVENSEAVTINSLSIASGMTLTLGANFTVTGTQNNGKLINSGTINTNGKTLTFKKYEDGVSGERLVTVSGVNAFGTPTGTDTSSITNLKFISSVTNAFEFTDVDKITIVNAEVASGITVTVNARNGQTGLVFTGCFTNDGTLKLNGDLTLDASSGGTDAGKLINNGTISMQGKNLSFKIYMGSSSGADKIIIGAAGTLIPTSASNAGTVSNLYFWGSRDFADVPALTFKNGWITTAGDTISFTTNIAFTETFTSNGIVSLDGHKLTAQKYGGNGGYIISNSVEIESTGADTSASGAVETVQSSTATTFTQTGFYKINNLKVNASTLTLASNISAGNVTIEGGATLDADSRGVTPAADSATSAYGCTTFGGGNVLTVSGNFINYNTGHSNATPYPGFVAQHGRVEITGNGTHEIRGNNKFHDFVCIYQGATLIFDANKTTNVDHQIWLEGSGSNLITLTTDNAAEGDKWTLDVIWSDVDGTAEHRKPHINYVAPHKSRSYSAKLKGCLVGCVDDAPNLRDSTNVNWFDDMPTIIMTVAPVGGKQLAVMFSSEVDAVSGTDLRTSVALKSNTGSNLIDPSVAVSMYTGSSDKAKTTVVYGLSRELTWNDLFGSDCLHVEVIQSDAVLVRGTNIKYQQGVKHCASDFAVNAARMLFGYDNYKDSSTPLTIEKGSNSVRTWDQSDPISNRLHSDSDLLFQAQFDASVPTGMKLEMVAMLDSQLNKSIISDNYMDYYGLSTRLWLPTQFQPISTAQQSVPSSQMISQDSTSSGRLRNFSLHYSKSSSSPLFQMKDGEEIQFLFKVKNSDNSDLSVDHDYVFENGVFTPVSGPVYAIRLVDDTDITSFDLWSVMLESTTLQRGNVTILNNVINSDQKEETFVTIQMQKAGSLTVQVLTLDGSVITTLQRGRKEAGTYGYSWDGSNGKGRPVSRGMYFIRVIGPDIDETRKVMVVRD